MKKLALALCVAMGLVLVPVKKSEAVVGLALGNPAVAVVGGLVIGGTIIAAGTSGCHGMGCLAVGVLALGGMGLGLIILDGETEAEVSFGKVSLNSEAHKAFNAHAIKTYNSELEELNAVRETIVEEVKRNPATNIQSMWAELGENLSPETLEIASFNGQLLVQSLK